MTPPPIIANQIDIKGHALANPTGRDHAPGYALEARGLTFLRGRQVILRNLDLGVSPGEFVGLHGNNGAGKTTLFHCLAGILRPNAGTIHWFGTPVSRVPHARRLIGYLGHESGLYLALTAWENLLFAAQMYGLKDGAERTREMLSLVGLPLQAHKAVGAFSRGMRQRLAIARAVIHRPRILLLDEAFTSLDASSQAWLEGFLRELCQQGCAILLASHDTDQSRSLADRLLCLRSGQLQEIPRQPGVSNHCHDWS